MVAILGCNSGGDPIPTGSATAAVLDKSVGQLRFYIGQPGVERDISKIESGESLPYHWWRIAIPTNTPLVEHTSYDLASPTMVEYWEFYKREPGCGIDSPPWTGKWEAGQQGVSGVVNVTPAEPGSYNVDFDFTYQGDFSTSCKSPGTVSSTNQFTVVVSQ